jgi:hypothetical protein
MSRYYFSANAGFIEIKKNVISPLFDEENLYLFIGSNDLCNKETFRNICKKLYKQINQDLLSSKIKFSPIVIISDLSVEEAQKHFNSLFFNSSIWFRYMQSSKLDTELIDINDELTIFRKKKLYHNNNAKEFFDFQLRLQNDNFLDNAFSEGHGRNVTPVIYSDEYQCLESIKKINKEDEKHQLEPKFDKREIQLYNSARFNILLVDDKKEKGPLIEELLNHFNETPFTKNTVWNDGKVKCCFFKQGFIEDKYNIENDADYLRRIERFAKDPKNLDCTKIFHLTTVRDAVRLLSTDKIGQTRIRFDVIMLDYLLDFKDGSKTEREYSSRLFEWLTNNKNEDTDSFGLGCCDKELIKAIKNNRGPLQKLWVFPITAFNQTFIDNLRNDGVRLIDYYWHISRGADPINTPYLFLRTLNSFLYLQLQQAVFDLGTLISFLNKTIKNINDLDFQDFQAHMGSEYTTIIQKHGWRSVISRDEKAGSLFSKYIWEKFCTDPENKFLFRLVDKMQKFFHVCTFADENDYDKMMLYWKELDIFIRDYWYELNKEYKYKEKITMPDLSSFRIKINNFLDKNKN